MNDLLAQARAAADKLADQTEDKGGSFQYEPPAAGPCFGRLVSYIEIGCMPQLPFKGAAKPPAPECIIEFQLLGKKHAKEIEVSGEGGNKEKKIVYPILRLGRGPSASDGRAVANAMTMPGGSKSNHYKLLKAMDYGRGNTHMAFMLGEAFKLNIVHNVVEKEVNGKKVKVTYANLRDENGVWQVNAPVIQKFDEETGDPVGEPQPIKVPAATVKERMLLWDAPSIEQWESLYIPGTYTKKEGDREIEVSKNWIQATVRSAVNYEGSGIQKIVSELEGDLPDVDLGLEGVSLAAERPADALNEASETKGTEKPAEAPSEPESGPNDDPLAELGL